MTFARFVRYENAVKSPPRVFIIINAVRPLNICERRVVFARNVSMDGKLLFRRGYLRENGN